MAISEVISYVQNPDWSLESLETVQPRFENLIVNIHGALKLGARYLGCEIQTFHTGSKSSQNTNNWSIYPGCIRC